MDSLHYEELQKIMQMRHQYGLSCSTSDANIVDYRKQVELIGCSSLHTFVELYLNCHLQEWSPKWVKWIEFLATTFIITSVSFYKTNRPATKPYIVQSYNQKNTEDSHHKLIQIYGASIQLIQPKESNMRHRGKVVVIHGFFQDIEQNIVCINTIGYHHQELDKYIPSAVRLHIDSKVYESWIDRLTQFMENPDLIEYQQSTDADPILEHQVQIAKLACNIEDANAENMDLMPFALRNDTGVSHSNIISDPIMLLYEKVCNASMSNDYKRLCKQKIAEIKENGGDTSKQMQFISIMLDFPWSRTLQLPVSLNSPVQDRISFFSNITSNLNRILHGQKHVKRSLIRILGKWIVNPHGLGQAIGFCGQVGTGKTSLASSLGKILNLPIERLCLGGNRGSDMLVGHSYTYSSAQPGKLVQIMAKSNSKRCIIFLDELDKLSQHSRDDTCELNDILIHLIDPSTNSEFTDRFFQNVHFDFSKVLFVFSYNDRSNIDPILLDRIDEITFEPYTTNDKLSIMRKHMIPQLQKDYKLECTFDKEAIDTLLQYSRFDPGVRTMYRQLETIFAEMNLKRLESDYLQSITVMDVCQWISPLRDTSIPVGTSFELPGVARCAYVSSNGYGGCTAIQVIHQPESQKIMMTGNMQSIMQECIHIAYSVAYKYRTEDYDYGYHVHMLHSNIPKNGTSAGLALCMAFYSMFTSTVLPSIVCIGEIDILGNIYAVGGMEVKIEGIRSVPDIKIVIYPSANKNAVDNIDVPNVLFFPVNHVDEVIHIIKNINKN